jgi:hypothetical protein|tara:strand:+ start:107 stop:517 length:411 start_codon:yes stop_codon:yes gene_type:complete
MKNKTVKLPWGEEYKLVPISDHTKNRSDVCNVLNKRLLDFTFDITMWEQRLKETTEVFEKDEELRNLVSGITDKLQNRLRISRNSIQRFMDKSLIDNDRQFLTEEKIEEGYWSPFVGRKSDFLKKLKVGNNPLINN